MPDTGSGRRRRRSDDDEAARLAAEMDADRDESDDDDDEITGKGSTMKSQLIDLAKRSGWRTLCKHFVENGTGSFSESEVTEMLTAVALKMHPDLKPDVAFAKLYSASTPDGELARRTTLAARDAGFLSKTATLDKAATLTPRFVGGADARSVNSPRRALDQLQALIAEQRQQHPELDLSDAQWFARVYAENPSIAEQERLENRPTAAR
jgi:hypothetical protein